MSHRQREKPLKRERSCVSSDLGPFLIIVYFEYFAFQVCNEIVENSKSENRFLISYPVVTLRLKMCVSVRHSFPIGKMAPKLTSYS